MRRGLFISFEGTEGCGKSTQIGLLQAALTGRGERVLVLREPGGTAAGEKIRDLLQYAPEGENLVPEAEMLLFAASRAQLVREKVIPAVEIGHIVVADRFHDSTTVYQGGGRGLDAEMVAGINRFALGGCLPDVTFLLDLDRETARRRLAGRGGEADRMEREPESFHEKVCAGYRGLARSEPGRFVVLDASVDEDTLHQEIWNQLIQRTDGLSD